MASKERPDSSTGSTLEVLASGPVDVLVRPCVDCGKRTGRYCDTCMAEERMPEEVWCKGQRTPLCSRCDWDKKACHYCRNVPWCRPFAWPQEHREGSSSGRSDNTDSAKSESSGSRCGISARCDVNNNRNFWCVVQMMNGEEFRSWINVSTTPNQNHFTLNMIVQELRKKMNLPANRSLCLDDSWRSFAPLCASLPETYEDWFFIEEEMPDKAAVSSAGK